MELYHHLSLPCPTDDVDRWVGYAMNAIAGKHWGDYAHVDPKEFLRADLYNALISRGLVPRTVFLFVSQTGRSSNNAHIHLDLLWDGSDWVPNICGVNWELTDTTTTFNWWDTEGEIYGLGITSAPEDRNILKSRSYSGKRRPLLNTVRMKNATLVRTEVTHSVYYEQLDKRPRCCASLRFEENGQSWDSIVDRLKDFIV